MTKGTLDVDGTSVVRTETTTLKDSHMPPDFRLHNQIKVIGTSGVCFADHGDSGSLLGVEIDGVVQSLGLVTAGDVKSSAVFITPLKAILNKFGLL